MRILVTCFEPFAGREVNAAREAVLRLPGVIAGAEIIKVEVPTVFRESIMTTVAYIDEFQPDVVVNVGEAAGRSAITPERVAINIEDASIPDNAGNQPVDRPIAGDDEAKAPAAYFATLPIKAMTAAINEAGVPARVSNTAGTFVCNHLMYGVLHYLSVSELQAANGQPVRAGFVHVPQLPEETNGEPGSAAMPLAQIVHGLTAALEAVVTTTPSTPSSDNAVCS